jgi:peptidylprolyl isomerase
MNGHLFVSYSAIDAVDFALRLVDSLASDSPAYHLWIDQRDLRPGEDWDEQVEDAIRSSAALLFLLSEDSVRRGSVCKHEWGLALSCRKRIIPLRLHLDADLPFRLGARQFIDFSNSFNAGIHELRRHLLWMATPAGRLQDLRMRLSDVRREFPRAAAERRGLLQSEIEKLEQEIDRQRNLMDQVASRNELPEPTAVKIRSEANSTRTTRARASSRPASRTPAPHPAAQGSFKIPTRPDVDPYGEPPPADLVVEDITTGDGPEARSGQTVTVHYAGIAHSTGEEFDASWNRGAPFRFPLGAGRVIGGWDRGVVGMRVGGRRRLVVPPHLGYGDRGAGGVIKPGETLVFVVDLLAVN